MAGLQMQPDKIARLVTCCFPASISLRLTCDSYVGLVWGFSTPARINFSLFIEAVMVGFGLIRVFPFNNVAVIIAVEGALPSEGIAGVTKGVLTEWVLPTASTKIKPTTCIGRHHTLQGLSGEPVPAEWQKA